MARKSRKSLHKGKHSLPVRRQLSIQPPSPITLPFADPYNLTNICTRDNKNSKHRKPVAETLEPLLGLSLDSTTFIKDKVAYITTFHAKWELED